MVNRFCTTRIPHQTTWRTVESHSLGGGAWEMRNLEGDEDCGGI